MKKRITILVFLIISLLCFTISAGCGGCGKQVVKPNITNIQVDVTDTPEAFSIGTYTFKSIKVNGVELTKDEYIVKNGYFIFAVNYYGELGLGENNVEIVFAQGVENFIVSVVDEKTPIYSLPQESVYYHTAQSAITLPMAEKKVIYQNFDIKYNLKNKGGEAVKTLTNPTEEELSVVLEKGLYKLDISVEKGEQVLDAWQGDIYVNGSQNLLSKENIANLDYDKAGLELSFDNSFGGLKVYKRTGQYGIESRIGIDYQLIESALNNGPTYLFFRYYSENGFYYDATGNPPSYLNLSLGYFKEQTGSGNVGHVSDIKVNPTDGTTGAWQSALIPLTENLNAKYLNFLVFARASDYFYMKDMFLLTTDDPVLAEQYQLSIEKQLNAFVGQELTLNPQLLNFNGESYTGNPNFEFESSNSSVASVNEQGKVVLHQKGTAVITITALGGKHYTSCIINVSDITEINYASLDNFNKTTSFGITMEFDENEQAIKLTKIGANISGNHSHIDMPILDEIRFAKDLGCAMLSFEYKAENIYGQGLNNPVLWVMATDGKVETIGSAVWVMNPISITSSNEGNWNKAVILFSNDNINNENYDYLVFLVGGDVGGTFLLRNVKYGTQQDYQDYYNSMQTLTLQSNQSLNVGETTTLVYSLTNIDGTDYSGDAKASWISSDNTIVEVDYNGVITAKAEGTATVTLSVLDGKYTATCTVEVNALPDVDYTTLNYALPRYFGSWNATGITMEYVDSDQVIKLTKQGAGLSGSHSHIELQIMDEIRSAKTAGMKMLTFEYYASGIYGSGANNPIIWIMANDGTANTVSSEYHIATPVNITAETEDKWVKVYIPFQDVYSLYVQNIDSNTNEYLMLLVGGEQGGSISIKNIKFGDAVEYAKYSYSLENYAAPKYFGSWNATGITMEYVDSDQVIKLTKRGASLSGSHSHIELQIMDEIRSAKAAGFTKLTFEYYASGIYGSGANNPIIWIMANDGTANTVSSEYHIATPVNITAETEDKWQTVEIPFEDVYWLYSQNIDTTTNEYLMLLIGGEQGGTISIRNIKLS